MCVFGCDPLIPRVQPKKKNIVTGKTALAVILSVCEQLSSAGIKIYQENSTFPKQEFSKNQIKERILSDC